MAKVFVSRKLPGNALDPLFNSGHEIVVSEYDRPLTAEEFLERAKGSDAVLSFLTDKIDKDVIDAIGPQVKIFSNYAVGFNNIVVEDATEKGVVIANTPSDEVNESVAEFAWALMMSLSKRVVEADESTRRGAYKGWEPGIFLGQNMMGKTLGIVGMGRIGGMTARRAKGWNMRILYFNRSRDEKAEKELGVEYASLDDLLSQSDFVTLHVPLTNETRSLMNKDTFAKMKKGALLVNTSRGPIVNEQDLVNAIREGQVGGAGLDVFENEPTINPELIGMENVILTPHIASATWEARNKMGEQAVNSIISVLAGSKPDTIVNPEVWEKRRV
ncbi:D-glycerate dehydrogenase [Candidatus Woesebacteria bacterium]|nr:MAG: D-glycerate dehydrogenase [Candidatus Woesebacteria bacterium]